jgi:hypothetical protein
MKNPSMFQYLFYLSRILKNWYFLERKKMAESTMVNNEKNYRHHNGKK